MHNYEGTNEINIIKAENEYQDKKENKENKENKDKKENKENKEKNEKNVKNEKKRIFSFLRSKKKDINKEIDNINKNSSNNTNVITFSQPQLFNETSNTNVSKNNMICYKENKIDVESANANINTNINDLDNIKFNNLLEQLESFYGNNISKEKLISILYKIKEIILLIQ